jgi:hypothetical protein
MKKFVPVVTIFCVIAGILLTGCANPREQLYGKWKVESSADLQANGLGELIFEFTKDGLLNISISGSSLKFLYSVKYEFVNDHSIRFVNDANLPSSLAGQTAEFKIEDNTMTLTNNGQPQTFTRVVEPTTK